MRDKVPDERKTESPRLRPGLDLAILKSVSVTPRATTGLTWSYSIPMTGLQIFTHNPTGSWSQSVPAAQ